MQRALTIIVLSSAHSGRLVLVAALMGLLAAAVLAAGNIARAQDSPEPTTHRITRGDPDVSLQRSLNAVFDIVGTTLDVVKRGDTIEFDPGVYEDIGRANGFFLYLDKENLTVRGARDPRLGGASGQCDPTRDTILTGAGGFELRETGITLEHFCFQDIDDGSQNHAAPHNLAPIRVQETGDSARIRRNRIDNTIGMGIYGRFREGDLNTLTIEENEFIDVGLIATNGAGDPIQPRGTGQEPSAIRLDTSIEKSSLRIVNNLFQGSAFAGLNLVNVRGGTISGNTFRNMAKSAVNITIQNVTLDDNTTSATTASPGASSKRPTG